MDPLTDSIIGGLESRGIPVDKTLLADRIAGVKCQHPTLLETLGDNAILIEVFDMVQQVAVASGEATATQPAAEITESPAPELTPAAATVKQKRPRSVLEEVQEELVRLHNPANVRLPQFEDKGYSWSLTL
ncbi:MAG: hypothetical protein M3O20_09580 [Acidobacteriota bacterium]|nr:hypothetical protein [Acidobacteriota bacterium]